MARKEGDAPVPVEHGGKSGGSQPEVESLMADDKARLLYEHGTLTTAFMDVQNYHMTSLLTILSSALIIFGFAVGNEAKPPYVYWAAAISSGFAWFGVVRHLNYTFRTRRPWEVALYKLEEQLGIAVWRVNIPFMVLMMAKKEDVPGFARDRLYYTAKGLFVILASGLIIWLGLTICFVMLAIR